MSSHLSVFRIAVRLIPLFNEISLFVSSTELYLKIFCCYILLIGLSLKIVHIFALLVVLVYAFSVLYVRCFVKPF